MTSPNTRSISVSASSYWRIAEAAKARGVTIIELVESAVRPALALGKVAAPTTKTKRVKRGPPVGSRQIPVSEQLKARFSRWCNSNRTSRIRTADEIINAAIDAEKAGR